MNKELIKFIELCLVDGVISDKERKVIFRKAKELGVPKDECEIILDGLVKKNAQKKNQPTKTSKELPSEKVTKKQEEIIDSRQPVKKKDVAKRSSSLSEIKTPLIIRLIINLFLGFGLGIVTLMLFNGLKENLYGGVILLIILIIVGYFLIRFFKIQFGAFEFVYFSLGVLFLNSVNYDNTQMTNLFFVGLPFILYVFIFYFAESDKKSVNKDIRKFGKKKTENSDKSPTLKMAEQAKKMVNKDIEKIEKRRGGKD